MKKFLILLFACLFFLCSCQTRPAQSEEAVLANDAEAKVHEFLRAVEAFDTDSAEKMLILGPEDQDYCLGMDDRAFDLYYIIQDDTPNLNLFMRYAAGKMSHRITSSQLDGARAEVNAYVKFVDGSDLLPSAYGALNNAFLAAGLNGGDYPEIAPFIDGEIISAIHGDSPAVKEVIVTFELEKQGEIWMIRPSREISSLFTACLFDDPAAIAAAMKAVGIEI